MGSVFLVEDTLENNKKIKQAEKALKTAHEELELAVQEAEKANRALWNKLFRGGKKP